MTPENFTYWLKGFFELLEAGPKTPEKLVLTAEQVEMIHKHLKSVFTEIIMKQGIPPTIDFTTKELPPGFTWPNSTPWPFMPQNPVVVTCGQAGGMSTIRPEGAIC